MLGESDEAVRAEAAAWAARMRGPNAEASAVAFEDWLGSDPRHADVWRELQMQWDQTKFLANTTTGRGRDLSAVAVWHRRAGPRRAAMVAGLTAICAGSLALWQSHTPQPKTAIVALATRTGEIRKVALSDGSIVTMDAASSLQVRIDNSSREVRMIGGTARFDIKRDEKLEFAVLTSDGSVTANGALFDIHQTSDLVSVAALRGSLSFKTRTPPPGSASLTSIAIGPGQRVDASSRGAVITSKPVPAPASDWTNGMLTFDRARLGEAITDFNRHNDQIIALTDPAIGELRITGAFHANDPAGFVRAVAAMLRLTQNKRADGALMLGPKK